MIDLTAYGKDEFEGYAEWMMICGRSRNRQDDDCDDYYNKSSITEYNPYLRIQNYRRDL